MSTLTTLAFGLSLAMSGQAAPQELAHVLPLALASGNVWDGGGKTYTLNQPVIISQKSGITIRNANIQSGADLGGTQRENSYNILGFDRCTNVTVENLSFRGEATLFMGFAQCDTVRVNQCSFSGGRRSQMIFNGGRNLTLENSSFIGGRQTQKELFLVTPGHPWSFADEAAKRGINYHTPDARWTGGTNLTAFIGDLGSIRATRASGGQTLTISTQGLQMRDETKSLTELSWHVAFVGAPANLQVRCISENRAARTAVLQIQTAGRVFPTNGAVTWYADNPEHYVRNVTIRGNTFVGSPKSSGMSLYFVDGYLVENNSAFNNLDYGMGAEYCSNGIWRGNVASGNQSGWNQLELVGFANNVQISNNLGRSTAHKIWRRVNNVNTLFSSEFTLVARGHIMKNVSADCPMASQNEDIQGFLNVTDPYGPLPDPMFSQKILTQLGL
ncbi:MAG: right-handed parallel beta-helix repeat-containing protein [Armatimonadetes bacterium]|nr:right-handed parallel beta-helix repeat-containing protein [Armatimonadota bacterium]